MKKISLIFAASFLCTGISAQEINKEITLDKEIIPEVRAASRPNTAPSVIRPEFAHSPLMLSDNEMMVGIPPYLTRLAAANTLPAVTVSPYKGYVRAGYFPAYNLGLSAGYQVVSDSVNRFNIFGQFNGFSYKRKFDGERKRKVTDNTGFIGADYTRHFNRYQRLDLDLGLLFSSTKLGYELPEDIPVPADNKNSAFGINFSGVWHSGTETENYYAGLSAEYFSNSPGKHGGEDALKGISQGLYKALFGICYHGFSIDVTVGLNSINRLNVYQKDENRNDVYEYPTEGKSKTAFVVSAVPAYTFRSENATAKIGVNLDYLSALGKNFSIAPDIRAAVAPTSFFSAYLNLTGGSELNTAATLYSYSHFTDPRIAYKASDVPLKADLGLVFGQFKGFSAEIHAGYAVANDWLMPALFSPDPEGMNAYVPVDLKGWRAGVRLKYEYSGFLTARAGITFAPQSQKKGWLEWRDRAKQVLEIDLSVRPIKQLSVNAGWELRMKRAESCLSGNDIFILGDLDDLSDLHVGAEYNFSDSFSVIANVNNILNKKALLMGNIPAQGLTGFLGVSYLF